MRYDLLRLSLRSTDLSLLCVWQVIFFRQVESKWLGDRHSEFRWDVSSLKCRQKKFSFFFRVAEQVTWPETWVDFLQIFSSEPQNFFYARARTWSRLSCNTIGYILIHTQTCFFFNWKFSTSDLTVDFEADFLKKFSYQPHHFFLCKVEQVCKHYSHTI